MTGADYYIYVSKYSAFTAGNDFVMSVNCTDCDNAPSNDDCDGAIAQVSGVTFTDLHVVLTLSQCNLDGLDLDIRCMVHSTLRITIHSTLTQLT